MLSMLVRIEQLFVRYRILRDDFAVFVDGEAAFAGG